MSEENSFDNPKKTLIQTNCFSSLDGSDPSVDEFLSDDVYQLFTSESFDSKVNQSFDGKTINEQIIKITDGIDLLNKSLHSLVRDKYEDLLAQSKHIDALEDVLKTIQTRIHGLLAGVQRIRTKLVDPYSRVCQQIVVLNRLQTTCDLLRQTIRIASLAKRLNEIKLDETEDTLLLREMTKAGLNVSQIEAIVAEDNENNLNKVIVIKDDLEAVRQLRVNLLERAELMFKSGLQQQDSNRLNAVLQVFHSLKVLNLKIRQFIDEKQDFISNAIIEALDVSAVTQGKGSVPGKTIISMTIAQNASLRSTLRQNIETLMENIFVCFNQISLIYRILKKKRDSLTNCYLIEQIDSSDMDGLNQFWSNVTKTLPEQLNRAANESPVIRQALETEYPNYLNSFSELWKRIARDHKDVDAEKVLRSAMQSFESAYLSRSLSVLFDSVNKVFADAKEENLMSNSGDSIYATNVPSVEDIDTIVRHISSELRLSTIDLHLCRAVAKNICTTINLFVVKCENLSSGDSNSTQVIGPLTQSQRLNATIVDRLHVFQIKIKALLLSLNCPPDCLKQVEDSLFCIENLMISIMNPIISSVMDAIDAILLTMHNENYSDETDPNVAEVKPSLYMKELQVFIQRVSNEYFTQFPDCEVTRKCIDKVADRTIELFLRQITIIRPLSQTGRLKIAVDFSQLEMALTPLCQPIGRLGRTFRTFRSFKPLLFQSADDISKSEAVGDLIPYWLTLQFLISSFAPNEIKLPHQYLNWSHSRWNRWLDQHSEESERLTIIRNSLESYIKLIRQTQGKSFASVYPIILEVIQKANKTNEKSN